MRTNFFMTFHTNRNYVKPMFWFVTPMVILLGFFGAIMTLQDVKVGEFAISNSIIYSNPGFCMIRMASKKTFYSCLKSNFAFRCFLIFLICFTMNSFAFFALSITFVGGFAFFRLLISFFARFAIALKPISLCSVFVKLRKRFNLVAFRASFRYDLFSHNQLPYSWLRLEPIAAHTVVGLFYFTTRGEHIK